MRAYDGTYIAYLHGVHVQSVFYEFFDQKGVFIARAVAYEHFFLFFFGQHTFFHAVNQSFQRLFAGYYFGVGHESAFVVHVQYGFYLHRRAYHCRSLGTSAQAREVAQIVNREQGNGLGNKILYVFDKFFEIHLTSSLKCTQTDVYDIKTVTMEIIQPRISDEPSTWFCSIEDLLADRDLI